MAKPALILVGADKGGVGKTTVARTLLDYFTAHHVPSARSILKHQRERSNAFIATSAKSSMPPQSPIKCASSIRCRRPTRR